MRKIFTSLVLSIFLSACSSPYDNAIDNIEKLLKVNLKNYNYEIKDSEHNFGFGEELIILSLVFSDKDFEGLLNKLDIDKWEKIDFDNGLKNSYDYSINYSDGDVKIWLFLGLKEKILKYSYYED